MLQSGIHTTSCKAIAKLRVFPDFLLQNTVVDLVIALRVNLVLHLEVAGELGKEGRQ